MITEFHLSNDEVHLGKMWRDFSKVNKVPLYICISSGLRRGIASSKNDLLNNSCLDNEFKLFYVCSLVDIMEKLLSCDRFIQF